jgi:hypothetical protein
MNIRASILLLAGCCLLSAGCQSETAIPSDTFHLSVEHVITHSELTVSLLKIHAPHDAYIHLDSEQFHHGGLLMGNSPGEAARDGQIAFSASRLAREGDHSTYIQTFMRAESFGNSVTAGPALIPVPAATALDTYFSISATSGDYKLDTPMEIGRLDGRPVTLVVGKPTK